MAIKQIMPLPLLIAHRGGMFHRPQNSLAAFEFSVRQGIEWVECDIRLTRDDVPILYHDDRLSTPNDGWKSVRELNYKQLKPVDIGGGQRIPTLRKLLREFHDKLHFDLEIKEIDAVEKTLPLIREFAITDRIVITSFIPEALQLVNESMPETQTGLLIDRLTGNITGARSAVNAAALLGCRLVAPDYRLIKDEWITSAHGAGMQVMAWTVNHRPDGIRLIEMGVDGLISDRPDIFKTI